MTQDKKMSATRLKKVETVKQLTDKLDKVKSMFLTDYRGLTHKDLEQLRKSLKKEQAEFLVIKNRLMKIALEKCNNETMLQCYKEAKKSFEESLNNPTAAFLAFGDEMKAIKELASFIKNMKLPKIKLGIFEGKLSSEKDFQTLATLPSREALMSLLMGRLQSPIYGLHYALSWNTRKLVFALNQITNNKKQNTN